MFGDIAVYSDLNIIHYIKTWHFINTIFTCQWKIKKADCWSLNWLLKCPKVTGGENCENLRTNSQEACESLKKVERGAQQNPTLSFFLLCAVSLPSYRCRGSSVRERFHYFICTASRPSSDLIAHHPSVLILIKEDSIRYETRQAHISPASSVTSGHLASWKRCTLLRRWEWKQQTRCK